MVDVEEEEGVEGRLVGLVLLEGWCIDESLKGSTMVNLMYYATCKVPGTIAFSIQKCLVL